MEKEQFGETLRHYVSAMSLEFDPTRQSLMRVLLLEEEQRFAAGEERLEIIDQMILESSERIRNQTTRTAELRTYGVDVSLAEKILQNLQDTQRIFLEFREITSKAQERRTP